MASKSCVILRLWFTNIFSKSGVWTKNALEMLKVRTETKFDFYLAVEISWTTIATASESCVIVRLWFSNTLSKSGVWTANALEILKVRKKTKFDFNLRVHTSRMRTAAAFISCAILRLYFSNVFSKCGASTGNGIEMLILRTTAKFEFSLTVDISSTTTATASKSCVILRF